MYTIEFHQHESKVVTCDRCAQKMSEDEPYAGYNNRTQIRFRAGYGSLFGDGNKIEGDLCDKCLYEVLGRYLRVVEPDPSVAREVGDDPTKPIEEFLTCRRGGSTPRTRPHIRWPRMWPWCSGTGSTRNST